MCFRSLPAGVSGTGGCPSSLKMDRYKTKLCLFHMQGRCCKGPHCPYAHGIDELRAPLPPGLLQAIQAHYPDLVLGGSLAAALNAADPGEYTGDRDDQQLLHSYFDDFQMHQLQGQMGMPEFPPNYECGPDYSEMAYPDAMEHLKEQGNVAGHEYGYGGGYDDETGHLDQPQGMSPMQMYDRPGQMNSLQQQAHARIAMAPQHHPLHHQAANASAPMQVPTLTSQPVAPFFLAHSFLPPGLEL